MNPKVVWVIGLLAVAGVAYVFVRDPHPNLPPPAPGLTPVKELLKIADSRERSVALFSEMSKVFTHGRCANCHSATDGPMQGDEHVPHQPLVVRGEAGTGAPGMMCITCHGAENFRNVPGTSAWILAPAELSWSDTSLSDICRGLKKRGELNRIANYIRTNERVSYGWAPPSHVEHAPGDQANLASLFDAWIDAGAQCPDEY